MQLHGSIRASGLALLALASAPTDVHAQAYPTKPIRLLVPYAPGGATDITARVFGPRLTESLGQQVIVDNRPGANGLIATGLMTKSAPDGYTLMLVDSAHGANPALYAKMPYDTLKDIAAINYVTQMPCLLLVHPTFPATSVKELIALAKAKPGYFNYGSAGVGSAIFLAMEQFKGAADIDVQAISYKGGGPAIADLIGGQLPMMFITVPGGSAHVRGGRVRALGVSSAKRVASFPEIPTIAESGLPGFENYVWQAFIAPAATPRAIVARLNADMAAALGLPDVKERILGLGADIVGSTPERADELIRAEVERWRKTIKPSMRITQ
jgi:tripartite-type tricarboxylate transporter receptor subunit TctC